jgi:glycosyltransferase involved in cell wall biosynthesis
MSQATQASSDRPPDSAPADSAGPDGVRLLVPAADAADPEVTILVPALDEELTIGPFIDWCHEGIRGAGTGVEIVIIDSSTDRTAEIAPANGARVLKTPRRGLGRAYIDAIPHVRGRFVIMGDADCTYDFRMIRLFVDAYRAGAEFVIGSRFRGTVCARCDAGLAPLFRHPADDIHPQPDVRQRILRHSLRHARPHARRVGVHGPALAGLGIRLRDGLEIGIWAS